MIRNSELNEDAQISTCTQHTDSTIILNPWPLFNLTKLVRNEGRTLNYQYEKNIKGKPAAKWSGENTGRLKDKSPDKIHEEVQVYN